MCLVMNNLNMLDHIESDGLYSNVVMFLSLVSEHRFSFDEEKSGASHQTRFLAAHSSGL